MVVVPRMEMNKSQISPILSASIGRPEMREKERRDSSERKFHSVLWKRMGHVHVPKGRRQAYERVVLHVEKRNIRICIYCNMFGIWG